MLSRFPHNPSAFDDDWEGQPTQSWFHKWMLGVALPVFVCAYGVRAIALGEANYSARLHELTLHGLNAIAFGVAATSAGAFLHFHYFWGSVYDNAWFAVLGKIVAACAFVAGLTTMIVRVGVLGHN